MDKLVEYLVEWFKDIKSKKCLLISLLIFGVLLFWTSFYLRENSEYASALLNGSMFLFWISFVYFLLYLSNKWKENIYEKILTSINELKEVLKNKNIPWFSVNTRNSKASRGWTLWSHKELKFKILYWFDDEDRLNNLRFYSDDKDVLDKIKKSKIDLLDDKEVTKYTSVPWNTVIPKNFLEIYKMSNDEIVKIIEDNISKITKNFSQK